MPRNDTSWKPGQSGNPKVRPRAVYSWRLLADSVADELPAVVRRLLDAAKEGDMVAARLLLDRVWPALKSVEPTPEAPYPLSTNIVDAGHELIRAASEGEIAVDQALKLQSMLATQARLVEHQDLAVRIAALEART
jgi:hypothetical protein